MEGAPPGVAVQGGRDGGVGVGVGLGGINKDLSWAKTKVTGVPSVSLARLLESCKQCRVGGLSSFYLGCGT